MADPRWSKESSSCLAAISKRLRESIETIAETLAKSKSAESVQVRDVEDAFNVISRSGINRCPWWQKRGTYQAVGAAVFSFAWSSDKVAKCPLFRGVPEPNKATTEIAIFVALLVAGACFFLAGTFAKLSD